MSRDANRDAGRRADDKPPPGDDRHGESGQSNEAPSAAAASEGELRYGELRYGELRYGELRWPIAGRTLRLMLWLATRQQRINEVASDRGQLWITWKGSGPQSIDGEVKTRLSGE
jgi:hypothetical protein